MTIETSANRDRVAMLEDALQEFLDLGGSKEFTRIQPNAEVINANPTDLPSGYIIIKNAEGYYQPAVTIPGVSFSNGDFANIIYIKGTEAIAFQAGSNSSTSGINAEYIQGRYVAPDAPSAGDVFVWSSDSNYWYPDAPIGGSGDAISLQGYPIAPDDPDDGDILWWSESLNYWYPAPNVTSGGTLDDTLLWMGWF